MKDSCINSFKTKKMKTQKEALKKQEAAMLKQFNVEELEERLEMKKWGRKKNIGYEGMKGAPSLG
jgi:hypothetical protein